MAVLPSKMEILCHKYNKEDICYNKLTEAAQEPGFGKPI
jgi:hypothetical protein